MPVNGIEIKEGQVWRNRGGAEAPVSAIVSDSVWKWSHGSIALDGDGRWSVDTSTISHYDLFELIEDARPDADFITAADAILGLVFVADEAVGVGIRGQVLEANIGDAREYTGGKVNYYEVDVTHPTRDGRAPYTAECNDIIEAQGMTFAEGEAFKAIWRRAAARKNLAKRGYTDGVYDAEKVAFYGQRMVIQERATKVD